MSGEREEIGKRSVGTHLLAAVQHPAWPELGFGAGLAEADEGKNAGVRPQVGEAGVRRCRRQCGSAVRRKSGCYGSQNTDLGKDEGEWMWEKLATAAILFIRN